MVISLIKAVIIKLTTPRKNEDTQKLKIKSLATIEPNGNRENPFCGSGSLTLPLFGIFWQEIIDIEHFYVVEVYSFYKTTKIPFQELHE